MKEILKDPFKWHVKKHYNYLLESLDHLTEETIDQVIENLKKQVRELEEKNIFRSLEKDTRSMMVSTLKSHIESTLSEEEYEKEQDHILDLQIARAEERQSYDGSSEEDYDYPDSESEQEQYNSEEEYPDNEYGWEMERKDRELAYKQWKENKLLILGDLNDLGNLIDICRDPNEGLSWLVHQFAEYELEAPDLLLDNIDFEQTGIDPELALAITSELFLDRIYNEDKVTKDGFVADAFIGAFSSLKERKIKSFSSKISMKDSLIEKLSTRSANVLSLIEKNKYDELREKFNDSYRNNDFIGVQKYWSVFSKYQHQHLSHNKDSLVKEENSDNSKFSFKASTKQEWQRGLANLLEKSTTRTGYYSRIYAHPETSHISYGTKLQQTDEKIGDFLERKERKTARMEISPLLDNLQTVGHCVKDTVKTHLGSFDTTNIVVPYLVFVVSTKPHTKGGEHGRICVKVPLQCSKYQNPLLSRETQDGVFDDPQTIEDKGRQYYALGKDAIETQLAGDSYKINNFTTNAALFFHSERVLLGALEDPDNIREVVKNLKSSLEESLNIESLEDGLYKVYAASLLLYSTNSVCDNCTIALIGSQNTHQQGFIKTLADALNSPLSDDDNKQHFVTRGRTAQYDPPSPEKFSVSIIARSDNPYTPQTKDMSENEADASKGNHNPEGKIHFHKRSIDLHALAKNPRNRASFVEIVSQDRLDKSIDRKNSYTGKAFASGKSKPESVQKELKTKGWFQVQ